MTSIRLGISTCPNDTFAFHGLLERQVDWQGLDFDVQLLDIQELNERLFRGEFDVAKASFHAALLLADRNLVLPCGSALGFGVGPLLLAAQPGTRPEHERDITLCPGTHTTATLLFHLFYPNRTQVQQVVFSEIMPSLVAGSAQFGVCIHEGRFTWQQQGLSLVEDLGTRWESATGCPLPLGGILAARHLGAPVLKAVSQVIRDSLEYSLRRPQVALPTMRRYAQEMDDHVLEQHVALYVNQWTSQLGATGTAALETLSSMAKRVGIIGRDLPDLEIFQDR